MLQGEHSAILLTFIKLPFVIKIFVLSIFEWPLKTGFTVVFLTLSMLVVIFCSLQTIWTQIMSGRTLGLILDAGCLVL